MPSFHSTLAPWIEKFIGEKRACGYKYTTASDELRRLDRFVQEQRLQVVALPQLLVEGWIAPRPNERVRTQQARVGLVRRFAIFLIRHGYPAYLPQARRNATGSSVFVPHIFSHEEMQRFLRAADAIPFDPRSPLRHLVLPEIFHVLYGCGLRVSEAINLRVAEVDLLRGVLIIRQGKFRKDRLVPLASSLNQRLRRWDDSQGSRLPDAIFFPSWGGRPYHRLTVYHAFRQLLWQCRISHGGRGRDVHGLAPERVTLKQIDPPLVLGFLDHLEKDRRCRARTRNLRLTALHSFFRYLQAEEPSLLLPCQRILAIPLQRQVSAPVDYLSPESLAVLLRQPDLTRRAGRRDAVLLSLLYDAGARVQELLDLSARDVRLASPAQLRITGKGRKIRIVPLMASTVELLREYLQEQGLTGPEQLDKPLFANRHGRRLSRSGVRYLVAKYMDKAGASHPGLALPSVSPHTFRHSKAMHLLQSGNPLVVIRDFLGHADIKSTEI
jgi:site-specific recombinase XerD